MSCGFAEASEAELQNSLKERRLCGGGGTASNICRRRKQHKVDEVAAGNGQILDLPGLNNLARLCLLSVDRNR
jgi:hypothetical protein